VLDASLYENNFDGAKWVMSPPLREEKDQQTLWAGINQGLVQVVATDHCPFMWEQKLMGKTISRRSQMVIPPLKTAWNCFIAKAFTRAKLP
jgi:dihydropyrimidinase